jgi:hypothetical protein
MSSLFEQSFEDQMKIAEWVKGDIHPHMGPAEWRIDCDGRLIRFDEYGLNSSFGWHKDHIVPDVFGGSDDAVNLRPRHWLGNTRAGGLLSQMLQNR